jgi:hypothetical protein
VASSRHADERALNLSDSGGDQRSPEHPPSTTRRNKRTLPALANVMKWWRRERAWPVDTDPVLAHIRQELSVTLAAG